MKKFYTNIPLQVNLQAYLYHAVDNNKLQMDVEHSFPILNAMNGYAEKGDTIAVYAVVTDLETALHNARIFEESVKKLCAEKEIHLEGDSVHFVKIPNDERITVQVDVFQRLIDLVEDNDELFYCATYGTKPQSMVLQMAMQYAYRIKTNTVITCAVYGKVTRYGKDTGKPDYAEIFDITALVEIDELVRILADRKVKNPREIIRHLTSV